MQNNREFVKIIGLSSLLGSSMLKKFKLIVLGLALVCLGLYVSESNTLKKDPALGAKPSWMKEQIAEDLTAFKAEGVKEQQLRSLLVESPPKKGLFQVKIRHNRFIFSSDHLFESSLRTRARHVKKFLKSLAKHYKLPDTEFVICLGDALDERDSNEPIFVFAKRHDSSFNVLFPDFEALLPKKLLKTCKQSEKEHPWELKREMVFWRGATSGGTYTEDNYFLFPRFQLVEKSCLNSHWLDAAFTHLCQGSFETLNLIVKKTKPLSKHVPLQNHFAYKYLIDIDGNSCTYERCRWILLSNSTLLKPASPNIQWYYKALSSYLHYVPLKEDLSDLFETYSWLREHDAQAKQIANQGQQLAKTLFSVEAVEEYVATLIYEYSQLYEGRHAKKASP